MARRIATSTNGSAISRARTSTAERCSGSALALRGGQGRQGPVHGTPPRCASKAHRPRAARRLGGVLPAAGSLEPLRRHRDGPRQGRPRERSPAREGAPLGARRRGRVLAGRARQGQAATLRRGGGSGLPGGGARPVGGRRARAALRDRGRGSPARPQPRSRSRPDSSSRRGRRSSKGASARVACSRSRSPSTRRPRSCMQDATLPLQEGHALLSGPLDEALLGAIPANAPAASRRSFCPRPRVTTRRTSSPASGKPRRNSRPAEPCP